MRQRAVIAIALALSPPMMIMDEPTTALDVVVQKEILQQIEELKDKLGFSILFITHDLSLMVEFSDRIAIMYAGQIVELAPAAGAIRRTRCTPTRQGLMNSFPSLTGPKRADRHPRLAAGHASPAVRLPLPPALHLCNPIETRVVPALQEVTAGPLGGLSRRDAVPAG